MLLLLLKLVLGHVNHVFDQIFSFKHERSFKIFPFAMIFFVLDEVRFCDDEIITKGNILNKGLKYFILKNHLRDPV